MTMSGAQSSSRRAAAADPHTALSTRSGSGADWTSVVPSALSARHLALTEHTPSSAERIRESLGAFCDGTTLSLEVEDSLFDSYIEDDYDGKLHLTTLETDDGAGTPVGLVFWREVPEDEMGDWLDFDALAGLRSSVRQSQLRRIEDSESGRAVANRQLSSLASVRQESLRWLTQASSFRAPKESSRELANGLATVPAEDVTHAWVKIELLAVRKPYWGEGYGTLLLACALFEAYKQHNSRAVLHVAGGKSNVPAVRLYTKFGFLPVDQGTIFHKPDRDLYVLGNIGRSLQELAMTETLRREQLERNKKDQPDEQHK